MNAMAMPLDARVGWGTILKRTFKETLDDNCLGLAAQLAYYFFLSLFPALLVVVTITSSRDPVLRGDWLRAGALVCAAGANRPQARELDNAVLRRAAFVCCDSVEDARIESGDLIEPVAQGVLDWLEVHELAEVVSGQVQGRQSDDDVVVFKSNGIAAWDVAIGTAALERARERGLGTEV